MLHTLTEIGRQLSENRHPWEDFLLKSKDREDDKKHLILPIVFDVDQSQLYFGDVSLYQLNARQKYGLIDILKGRNKAIYVGVPATKLDQMHKSLFGKSDAKTEKSLKQGEFLEVIHRDAPELKKSEFYTALRLINSFELFFNDKFKDDKGKFGISGLTKGPNEVFEAVYAAISCKEYGWEAKPLAELQGYSEFIERKFIDNSNENRLDSEPRLCYASGELRNDTSEAVFSARYNLNKIFQATNVNFASYFESGNLRGNYQVSSEIRQYLDRGSEKVLNDYRRKICGVDHVCIPRLPIGSQYDISDYKRLKKRADLIFELKDMRSILGELSSQTDDGLYWLDFYGIESDGNYLKITSHIRDVSGHHVHDLFREFKLVSEHLRVYLNNRQLNLGSLYFMIPVRKGVTSNQALDFCKIILEQRCITENHLFQHFTDLALCHWFSRYEGYANIDKPIRGETIDSLLRNAVFTYLAFRKVLVNLKLLYMETTKQEISGRETAMYLQEETRIFLEDMGYSQHQRAMFFLGKALKQIVNVQRSDGKTKTALDMVNFNGIDARSILQLATGIMDKGRQYRGKHGLDIKVERYLKQFYHYFPGDTDAWDMDGKEALFFFLSGYTHFVPRAVETEHEDSIN